MTKQRCELLFDEAVELRGPLVLRPFKYGNDDIEIPFFLDYMWSKVGISSWLEGTLRTCDPESIWPSLNSALEDKILLRAEECMPYLLTAFGLVLAWNNALGVIRFDFQRGRITCVEDPRQSGVMANVNKFVTPFLSRKDAYDQYDLYDIALKQFGPLGEDQIFSFAPIFALGGQPKRSNLIVTDVRAHLTLLAQSQEFDILHFDSERYPGGFERIE